MSRGCCTRNPGNSGGPLINARGQAIAINTAIFTQTGGSVGIGFAIPIDLAKTVVTQLASVGHVVRGYLGVSIQPVTPDLAKGLGLEQSKGALVASVVEGSPAARAGVRASDVITEYNGRPVARSEDLPRAVAETPVGREVPMTVIRDGRPVTLRATVAKLDEPAARPTAASKTTRDVLGLALQRLTPAEARERGLGERSGLLVRGVQEGSAAANAGLQPGDVITEINRAPVKSVEDVKQVMDKRAKDKPALFLVHRNGASIFIAVS